GRQRRGRGGRRPLLLRRLLLVLQHQPRAEPEEGNDEHCRENVAERRATHGTPSGSRHHSETPLPRLLRPDEADEDDDDEAGPAGPSSSGGVGSSEKLSNPANSSR